MNLSVKDIFEVEEAKKDYSPDQENMRDGHRNLSNTQYELQK